MRSAVDGIVLYCCSALGDCPFGGAFSLVFSLEFSLEFSIDDRSWRATQRGLERPRYKHTTLLYSLAVKVFEFPPSHRLVRVCKGVNSLDLVSLRGTSPLRVGPLGFHSILINSFRRNPFI